MDYPNSQTEPLQTQFNPQTLTELMLVGTSLLAAVRYHDTPLPKRGFDALLGKLPLVGNAPISIDLDLSCLLFDQQYELLDLVWYGKLRTDNEAIRHSGDALSGAKSFEDSLINQEEIRIRPDELDCHIAHMVFVLTSHHNQPIRLAKKGMAILMDNEQNIAHSIKLDTLPRKCQAVLMWHLSKDGDDWRIDAPALPLSISRQSDKEPQALVGQVASLLNSTTRWAHPQS